MSVFLHDHHLFSKFYRKNAQWFWPEWNVLKSANKEDEKIHWNKRKSLSIIFSKYTFCFTYCFNNKREPERMKGWERIESGVVYHVCYQYTERWLLIMQLFSMIVDFYSFYDGRVDMQIWDILTWSHCRVIETQATGVWVYWGIILVCFKSFIKVFTKAVILNQLKCI